MENAGRILMEQEGAAATDPDGAGREGAPISREKELVLQRRERGLLRDFFEEFLFVLQASSSSSSSSASAFSLTFLMI